MKIMKSYEIKYKKSRYQMKMNQLIILMLNIGELRSSKDYTFLVWLLIQSFLYFITQSTIMQGHKIAKTMNVITSVFFFLLMQKV